MARRARFRAAVAGAVVTIVAGTWAVAGPVPIAAATSGSFAVTRPADDHAAGSLRATIDQANAAPFDTVTITLPAGTYVLDACAVAEDDTNTAGDLDALGSAPLTIEGAGGGAVIRQSCAHERVLDQRGAGLLTLRNVTITGGSVLGNPAVGGGIRAQGAVTLDHATITGNAARGLSGGPGGMLQGPSGGDARGGGIAATGEVTVTDSSLTQNISSGGPVLGTSPTMTEAWAGSARAGAIDTAAAVHLVGSTIADNLATGGYQDGRGSPGSAFGGAIVSGPLDATTVTFSGNRASGADGWAERNYWACLFCQAYYGSAGGVAYGGAAHASTVTLHDVTSADNQANAGDGVWGQEHETSDARGGSFSGTGTAEVVGGSFHDNATNGRGGVLRATTVSISGATFQDNDAERDGGAVIGTAVTVTNATFVGNHGQNGGAVDATSLDVTGSRFEGNHGGGGTMTANGHDQSGLGGAVHATTSVTARATAFLHNDVVPAGVGSCYYPENSACNQTVVGGAIAAHDVTLDEATVAGNKAQGDYSTRDSDGGGGIFAEGSLTARNSTITQNTSGAGDYLDGGGAVRAATTDLTQVTVAGNAGTTGIEGGTLTAHQSILALHQGGPLCSAATVVTSQGSNWGDDGSCHLNEATDHEQEGGLYLGPLQDNGGPTPTRRPAAFSGTVDAVDAAGCASAVDQRGVSRPQGAGCDVGAVEIAAGPPPAAADLGVAVDGPTAAPGGRTNDVPVTVTSTGGTGYPTLTVDLDDPTPDIWLPPSDVPAGAVCIRPSAARVVCTWDEGLAAGASATLTLHVTLGKVEGASTVRARVTGAGPDGNRSNDEATLTTTRRIGPDVYLSAAVLDPTDASLVQGGASVNLRIGVGNLGPVPHVATAENPLVVIVDVPPNMTVGAQPWITSWTCTGSAPARCSYVGVIQNLYLVLPLSASPAFVPGSATVHVHLEGTSPDDLDTTNHDRDVTFQVIPGADVETVLSLEGVNGRRVRATAVVTNHGPSPSRAQLLFSAEPGWSIATWTQTGNDCQSQTGSAGQPSLLCTSQAPLAPGASTTITVTVDAAPTKVGTAWFSYGSRPIDATPTRDRMNGSVAFEVPPADLGVTVTGPASAPVGSIADYAVTVSSTDGSERPRVTISVPAGWDERPPTWSGPPAVVAPAGTTCDPVLTTIACTWTDPLPTGTTATVLLHVRLAPTLGDSVVSARVSGPRTDQNPGNDTASWTTTRAPGADLSTTLAAQSLGGPTFAGTVTVTNAGTVPAVGGRVHVAVPPGTRFRSVTAPGWACTTGVELTCDSPGELVGTPAGQPITFVADAASGLTTAQAESWIESTTLSVAHPHAVADLPYVVGLGSWFHPLAPTRLLDSRSATGGWSGPLAAGAPRTLRVGGGTTGVPAGLDAVVLNVTVTGATADSFLKVYPLDGTVPSTSNLNFARGQTIPNAVTVKVGPNDLIAFANATGAVHVVVDVVGYYDSRPGDRFVPVTPTRLLDSRTGTGFGGKVVAGTPKTLPVTSVGGVVPVTAHAVVLNVTVTAGSANSFLTVYPAGPGMPTASNLNFAPGETTANQVTVKLSADGRIAFANAAGAVDVVADVVGFFDDTQGDLFHPIAPARLLDSRGAVGGWAAPLAAGTPRQLTVTGGSVRPDATAVVGNATVTGSTAPSYLTIQPAGTPATTTSSVNFAAGQTIPNLTTTKVGANHQLTFGTKTGSTHVVYDLVGWYAPT